MTVDFHVHSTASDGTFSPSELVAAAKGFRAIALTDHDNTLGITEFLGAKFDAPSPLRFSGIELSIEPGDGFDSFHLLGLGIDHNYVPLKAYLKRVLDGRNARNERIFANFAKLGIYLTEEDLAVYAKGEVLARPHFASWLVAHQYASDNLDAFNRYLLADSPSETRCYEERWHPPQAEAFELIHNAGGLCIMAHPKFWRRRWKTSPIEYDEVERELCRLKAMGLDGLEASYSANTGEETVAFSMLADRLGLIKSAGSDFHGTVKPNVTLGMTVTETYIAPLLERLNI